MKIKAKINTLYIVLFTTMLVGVFLIFLFTSNIIRREVDDHLRTTIQSRGQLIESLLNNYQQMVKMLSTGNPYKDGLDEKLDKTWRLKQLERRILSTEKSYPIIKRIRVLNKNGDIIMSSDKREIGTNLSIKSIFQERKNKLYTSNIHKSKSTGEPVISISTPIFVRNKFSGLLIVNFSMEDLYKLFKNRNGLGNTGRIFLVDKNHLLISPLSKNIPLLKTKINTSEVQLCFNEHIDKKLPENMPENCTLYKNFTNEEVLGIYYYIPLTQWALITEIKIKEVFQPVYFLIGILLSIFFLIFIIQWIVTKKIYESIVSPIRKLLKGTEEVINGNLNYRVKLNSQDELGELSRAFNLMTTRLKEYRYKSKEYTEELEKTVNKRTAELNKQLEKSEKQRIANLVVLKDLNKTTQNLRKEIAEKEKVEQQLRKLSTAVTQSPAVIAITNTQGALEYVNPKFEELTGYSQEEVTGKNPRILKSGELPFERYKELWDTISSGKKWHGEFHNKKKNGELFWESASVSPILNKQGKIINYIKVAEDITEKKKMIDELIKAKEKAQESDRLKSAFLANMSHEIRTPMNGILGFTSLLEEENLSTEVRKEYIEAIQKSGDRMMNTINAIMDISKIEAGMVEVSSHEVNINHNIEDIYKFFSIETQEKGIRFSYKTALSTEESAILSDGNKVYAILTNLVKNAIKYTSQGAIDFGYVKKDDLLEFYVKDTGMGIPKDRHQAVFDRFVQADVEDRLAMQGNGLGLSIVKAYVKMLGGEIWLEYSEPGQGSEFRFTLPYIPVYPDSKNTKGKAEKDKNKSSKRTISKRLKILVAEDDETSCQYLSVILKDIAETILYAENGKETIQIFKDNPDIDLILMDMMMPVMNGYQATRQIRMFDKDIVIIAQTAYAMADDKEKILAAGCNDYITKPISVTDLKEVISKYWKDIQN